MAIQGAPITLTLTKVSFFFHVYYFEYYEYVPIDVYIYIYIYVYLCLYSKDQKSSFGLTLIQHDDKVWVQSVQPHGAADQVYIIQNSSKIKFQFTFNLIFSFLFSKISELVIK